MFKFPEKWTGVIVIGIVIGIGARNEILKFSAHPNEKLLYETSRFEKKSVSFSFEEVAEKIGIHHLHGCFTPDSTNKKIFKNLCAANAAVAVADIDGDGFQDIFFTTMQDGSVNFLYHNKGDGSFEDISADSGIVPNKNNDPATGALFFDFDNDGKKDLLVIRTGCSCLYRNVGGGRFLDVSDETGIGKICGNAVAVNAFDYDRDGRLDLVIANFWRGKSLRNIVDPVLPGDSFYSENHDGGHNLLLKNIDGKFFQDVSAEAGIDFSAYTWAIGISDFDRDGYPDIFLANDFGRSMLLHNEGGKKFKDITWKKGVGQYGRAGMNAEIGDLDNQDVQDIYVTNITWPGITGSSTNTLWKGNKHHPFSEIAKQKGAARCGWGWGAKFADFDRDGWLDIFVTGGFFQGLTNRSFIYQRMSAGTLPNFLKKNQSVYPSSEGFSVAENHQNCLFHREGASFVDVAPEVHVDQAGLGKGVALIDHLNKGALSVVVARSENRPFFYENHVQNDSHWIGFHLRGKRSNKDAWGALLKLKVGDLVQTRELYPGNGFKSQSDERIFFGLGQNKKVDSVEVIWPSGQRQLLKKWKVDRYQDLNEP